MNSIKTFLRFCAVGVLNTAIDVTVYTLLYSAGLAIVMANFISTSLGLGASYVLNSKFTFRRGFTPKRMALFLGGTLIGLWVLQPIFITMFMQLDSMLRITDVLALWLGHQAMLASALPKLGAVGVTLVWNYMWYTHVVYAGAQNKQMV